MRQGLGAALLGGALGCLYVASPTTVLFAIAVAGLFAAAARGLTGRERRWVLGVLTLAVGLRLLILAVFVLSVDHDQVGVASILGDAVYVKSRSLWLRNVWLGVPIAPTDFESAYLAYGWTGYLHLLAVLQVLLGPMPYGMHLVSVGFFLAAAVLLHRLVRRSFGPVPALGSLAAVLFLPSLFVWSISGLKESVVVLTHVAALVAGVRMLRAESWLRRVAAAAVAVAAVVLGSAWRSGGTSMIGVGLAAGLAARVALLNVATVILGLVVTVVAADWLMEAQPIQTRVAQEVRYAASLHLGHVNTVGYSYKLLDERFYTGPTETGHPLATMTFLEGARFIVRAALSFVFVPLPWQMNSASALAFLPQQMLWYLLILLSVVGAVVGMQKDPLVTLLLAGSAIVGGGIVAVTSGNIGTMVRHRDMVAPFVVCLSGVGATWVCARLAGKRPERRHGEGWPSPDAAVFSR